MSSALSRRVKKNLEVLAKINDEQKKYLELFIKAKGTKDLEKVTDYHSALLFILGKGVIKFDDGSSTNSQEDVELNNVKLGKMGSDGRLFGSCVWHIPEFGINELGTCGEFCVGCFNKENPRKSACYCAKSYYMHTFRNADGSTGDMLTGRCYVKLGHFYRTVCMRYFKEFYIERLDLQLKNKLKRDKKEGTTSARVIRIDESGELECKEDLIFWCDLAKRNPEYTLYIYTKNYDAVRFCVNNKVIPTNMWVNISIWHESGINEYIEMSAHKQVRAFVYVDDEFTVDEYAKREISITSMCPAYDANGVMNHDITCDKCGKTHCYSARNKVTGCFAH